MCKYKIKRLARITELNVENIYPGLLKDINDNLELYDYGEISFHESIYLYINGIKSYPLCVCGNRLKYKNFNSGYLKYCSKRCAALETHKNIYIKNKRINSFNMYNNDKILKRQNTLKANKTKKNFTIDKKQDIINKRIESCNLMYGVDNVSKLDNIYKSDRIKKTKRSNYLKRVKSKLNDINYTFKNIIRVDGYNDILNCVCDKGHNFEISKYLLNKRLDKKICTVCNPLNMSISNFEIEVREYIKSLNVDCLFNDRSLINPFEIDILIPDYKLAIECNGMYWHSDKFKSNMYHENKTSLIHNKKYDLIHIWEKDWNYKKDIVKSIIKNKLNKSYTIYARKCIIKKVSINDSLLFLNSNHLSGYIKGDIIYGLYYKDSLVYIISFNVNENCYEISRFCNLKNYVVVGAFSKILKHFINEYKPINIISYCCKDMSKGNILKLLNFKLLEVIKPSNFYIDDMKVLKYYNSGYYKFVYNS